MCGLKQISITACLSSLQKRKTVRPACRLTGNVGDHDEDEEGVVIKREVVLVGESDRVQAGLLHVRQRCIDSQQFPSHSHGIQHNEEGVPAAEGFVKDKAGERNNTFYTFIVLWFWNMKGWRYSCCKQANTEGNMHEMVSC